MAAVDAQFAQLLMQIGIADDFKDFLKAQLVFDADMFGRLCSTEAEVKIDIIAVAQGAHVKFDNLAAKGKVVKLWGACREIMKGKAASKEEIIGVDQKMPKPDSDYIEKQWKTQHNIVLPEDWLLIETLQGEIWRAVTASPHAVPVILVEHLRTLSCSDKPVGMTLALVPGRAAETGAVISDAVTKPMEIYNRIRAFFYTAAYVSIKDPTFFEFQTAIILGEKVQ